MNTIPDGYRTPIQQTYGKAIQPISPAYKTSDRNPQPNYQKRLQQTLYKGGLVDVLA